MACCKLRNRTKVVVFLGGMGLFFVIVGCVFLGLADKIIHTRVASRMPLTNKGKTYDQWKHSKSPLYFQVYAFDILNPDGVLNGDKPKVEQKGPYTYRDERSKTDIKFSDDGTVFYKERREYIFDRGLSVGSDSDIVTVPNLAMASVMSVVQYKSDFIKQFVNQIFKQLNETLFVGVSVHDLVWGYQDQLLEQLAPLAKFMNFTLPENNTIGLFTGHNDTNSDHFVIYSGEKGLDNFAEIVSWNDEKKLKLWTSDYANTLNGSLGTLFPPFVKKEKHYFFSTDLTRTLGLDYQKEEKVHNIPLYKFVAPAENFANVTINPDNAGFCTPAGNCLPSGLLNISKIHYGAPVVASNPHFLFCDKDIRESIAGMKPDQENHQTHINIEPLTGVNMDFAINVQINVHLEKIKGFRETQNLSYLFMPTAWISENAKISKEQAKEFKHQVLDLITALHGIMYGCLAFGCLLLVIAAATPLMCKLCQASQSSGQTDTQQQSSRSRQESTKSELDPLLSSCMDSE